MAAAPQGRRHEIDARNSPYVRFVDAAVTRERRTVVHRARR
jgi:hypothetical protein